MEYSAAYTKEREKMTDQMKTKFPDQEIRDHIDVADHESDPLEAIAFSQIAMAKIKYNEMINNRWKK